jgi:hypothetical protein
MQRPRVLISWAHAHRTWGEDQVRRWRETVEAFARVLADCGLDVEFDLWNTTDTAIDFTRWGPRLVEECDYTVVAISEAWQERWEGRNPPHEGAGVAVEADAMRGIFERDQARFQRAFVVALLPGAPDEVIPNELRRLRRERIAELSPAGADALVALLTRRPAPGGPARAVRPEPVVGHASAAARAAIQPDILPSIDRLAELTDRMGEPERVRTPLVITGEGGYGKSVLLGQLYDRFAPAGPTVLVPCGRVPASAELTGLDALDRALGDAAGDTRAAVPLTRIVAGLGTRPRLLVDTLDLVVREENADDLAFLLRRLAERADLTVTCRDREWRDYLEADRGLAASLYPMPALTAKDILDWADAYVTAIGTGEAARASFLASLASGPVVREVCATPLRLAMACQIYAGQGGIPEDLTVTELYEQYWQRRVAVDRYGRRTGRARVQEATAEALAAEVWELSTSRFVEYVPARQQDPEPLDSLVSDGVVTVAAGRYGFFHQTYAEFAVARRLARVGDEADLLRLSDGLTAASHAYWPIAKHLLMLDTSADRYARLAECVPPDTVEGVRTRVLGAFNRRARDELAAVLDRVAPALLLTGVRVLESSPEECLDVALDAVVECLTEVDGPTLPRVATTAAALATRAGAPALRRVVDTITARVGELDHDPVSSVLSRLIEQVDPGPALLPVFVDAYAALPEAARATVVDRVAGAAPDPALDAALLTRALRELRPPGVVDQATAVLHRTWSHPEPRALLGWRTWSDMFEADLPGRWDSCQVRLLARLCLDGAVAAEDVLDTALGPGNVVRDRYTNAARFIADAVPGIVLAHLLRIGHDLGRGAVGTLCSLLNHMADHVPAADRPALIALLERHLHVSDRRVWPAIVKLCGDDTELLRAKAAALRDNAGDVVRRSAFDTFVNVLDPSALAAMADEVRVLLPYDDPRDRVRRAKLEGVLTPCSAPARDWVEREFRDGTSDPVVSAAAGALVAGLAHWSPEELRETALPWLTRLLRSPRPNAVRLVAEGMRPTGIIPLDADQADLVLDRLVESLAAGDDTQVQGALLDLLVGTEHTAGLAGHVVTRLLATYRGATATGFAPGADARTTDRLPAVFRQYVRTVTAVAIRHLTPRELLAEIEHILTTVDVGRIANRSRRPLASLLLAAVQRHAALLAELERLWQHASPANKHAIAETVTTYEAGTAGIRSLALARRADCPPEVANFLHSKFPH